MTQIEQAILNERLRVARSHITPWTQERKLATVKMLRLARERKAAETGQRCGGTAPFGTFPGEKEILDYIVSLWHADPRPGYSALARHLNAAAIVNRSGGRWTAACLCSLLKRIFSRQSAEKSRTVYSDETKTKAPEA